MGSLFCHVTFMADEKLASYLFACWMFLTCWRNDDVLYDNAADPFVHLFFVLKGT